MDTRSLLSQDSFAALNTDQLRAAVLIDSLFKPGEISMTYCELDRAIAGSAVPSAASPLVLEAGKEEMGTACFTERREIGIINIGRPGTVRVGSDAFHLESRDGLYVGKGNYSVSFESDNPQEPALFYFVSYPAHSEYPVTLVPYASAEKAELGCIKDCNVRTINKYILPSRAKSCQLVMGLTEIQEGSVWNTMPSHTHRRRSEIYMYFDMDEDGAVVHLMGAPGETRHVIIRNGQAVLNPSWSIHSGAGTRNYSFIWAMGGENQDFDDMDWVKMQDLK